MKGIIAESGFWSQIEAEFGNGGGVYFLFCFDADNSIVPISRLLGNDVEGVLYIGMATSFLNRVIELKKSLSPEHISSSHECGARYKSHKAISQQFPYERLAVKLFTSDNPREAERDFLQKYYAEFGELPPFNRAG